MPESDQDNIDLYGDTDSDLYDDEPAVEEALTAATSSSGPSSSSTTQPAAVKQEQQQSSSSTSNTSTDPRTQLPDIKKTAPVESASSSFSNGGMGGSTVASGGLASSGGNSEVMRPSDMPDEGKMFIGGLNWQTSDEGLKQYMSQYGPVEHCTIMRDPAGKSRGFGFLTFTNPSSVDKVVATTHNVDGKQIDPKRAIPHEEHKKASKIFVGGLLASTTIDTVKEHFSQYGTVLDAQVMVDKESGRSKGFGFVTFSSDEACEKVVSIGMVEIDGKQVEVKRAQPRNGPERNPRNGPSARPTPGQNFGGGPIPGSVGTFTMPPQQTMMAGMMGMPGMMGMGMGGMGGMGGGQQVGSGGMGAGGQAGGFDPNAMMQMYQRMMAQQGMGMNPMMRPQMMNPGMGNVSPSYNPMMGAGGATNPMFMMGGPMGGMGNTNGGARPMGMNPMMGMGGMGARPNMGMGMGMGGFPMAGMPGMANNNLGGGQTSPNQQSISSISGGISPNLSAAVAGNNNSSSSGGSRARSPNNDAQQQQQGMGPARFNTKGQSHFKPY